MWRSDGHWVNFIILLNAIHVQYGISDARIWWSLSQSVICDFINLLNAVHVMCNIDLKDLKLISWGQSNLKQKHCYFASVWEEKIKTKKNESEFLRAWPCWFAPHQWRAEKDWLVMHSRLLPHNLALFINYNGIDTDYLYRLLSTKWQHSWSCLWQVSDIDFQQTGWEIQF